MAREMRKYKINNAVMLMFTVHSWGNRKAADKDKIETVADKELLNLTKNLIERKGAYRDLILYLKETRKLIRRKSVPLFFRDGLYLFNIASVEDVEKFIEERTVEIKKRVEALVKIFPEKIKEIESRLGDQFDSRDYPTIDYIRRAFYISYQWVAFDVPEGLPKDIFEAEKKKAEELWSEAAMKITMSLRESFKKLIAHAVDVLSVGQDGKTKKFKDSSFNSINEFIESFKTRNIVNDTELADLVAKAEKVLADIDDPQDLKSDDKMRTFVQKGFSTIEKKLDTMIVDVPTRRFDFDDE